MAAHEMVFPLFERAERVGLLDGESGLVMAPTATGRSQIGREAIRRALNHDQPGGLHAYLVPYRALPPKFTTAFCWAPHPIPRLTDCLLGALGKCYKRLQRTKRASEPRL